MSLKSDQIAITEFLQGYYHPRKYPQKDQNRFHRCPVCKKIFGMSSGSTKVCPGCKALFLSGSHSEITGDDWLKQLGADLMTNPQNLKAILPN